MNKEQLIALAKELSELENLTGRGADLAFLKREWKRLNNFEEETLFEQQQTQVFNSYYEKLAGKETSLMANTYEEKKAIVAKAKELLNREDIKKAQEELNELFNNFKHVGRCTKEQDDELWAEFKAVKDEFSKKRQAYYKEIEEKFAARKAQKLDIIERAKKVLEVEIIKEASAQMDVLMEEWKHVGFTGKEEDDNLWNEFKAVRSQFFDKKKQHFNDMMKLYNERVAKKEEMIQTAKQILADSDFNDDEVEQVKNLRKEWTKVGFAGKEKDDELYQEFDKVIKQYFDDMKFYKY